MAKRHVYSKDASGYGDFIYVDLLPELKRARQFNVNVVVTLLYAIVLAFFLIYNPYSDRTFQLEEITSLNNDLTHELALTQEEFKGYEINLEAINFQSDINRMNQLRVDLNNLVDDIELIVDDNNGRIKSVRYDAETNTMLIQISLISQFSYNSINNSLLNLSWVNASSYGTPYRTGDSVEYTSEFTIGVDYNVE